jgi:hypothetical protein
VRVGWNHRSPAGAGAEIDGVMLVDAAQRRAGELVPAERLLLLNHTRSSVANWMCSGVWVAIPA